MSGNFTVGVVEAPVWTNLKRESSVAPAGNRTTVPQLFRRGSEVCTAYAVPVGTKDNEDDIVRIEVSGKLLREDPEQWN
jgi:hypothetical protein